MTKADSYLKQGIKVIDLSADFRIKDTKLWKEWYGSEHKDPSNLTEAVYGLTELSKKASTSSFILQRPSRPLSLPHRHRKYKKSLLFLITISSASSDSGKRVDCFSWKFL